jgi:hypothetical protein
MGKNMSDISDLVDWYNKLRSVDTIEHLSDIKRNSLVRIIGTMSAFEKEEGIRHTGTYNFPGGYVSQFLHWHGKIRINFVLRSGEHLELVANYAGRDKMRVYNDFYTFLEGLGYNDKIEAVGRVSSNRNQNNVAYLIIANGQHFLRGQERSDYLKRLSQSFLEEFGIR